MADNAERFNGRQVIGENTEILNGVFFGDGAIVVDYVENPDPYERAYELTEGLLARSSRPSPLEIALAVNNVVTSFIQYSEVDVAAVLKREAEARGLERISREDEVGLSLFVDVRGGVCHHQTLFGGSMIRLLQKRLDIGGHVGLWLGSLDFVSERERHTCLFYGRDGDMIKINSSAKTPVKKLPDREAAIRDRYMVR